MHSFLRKESKPHVPNRRYIKGIPKKRSSPINTTNDFYYHYYYVPMFPPEKTMSTSFKIPDREGPHHHDTTASAI